MEDNDNIINRNQICYAYYFRRFAVPFFIFMSLIIFLIWWVNQQVIIINNHRLIHISNWKPWIIGFVIWALPAIWFTINYILTLKNNQKSAKNNDDTNTIINIERSCFWPLIALWIIFTFPVFLIIFLIWWRIRKKTII